MKNRVSRFVLPVFLGCVLGALSLPSRADGSVTSLNPGYWVTTPTKAGNVKRITTLSNGYISVGGNYGGFVSGSYAYYSTIYPSSGPGSPGTLALPNGIYNGEVCAVVEQPNGRFLVAGAFTNFSNDPNRDYLTRIYASGYADAYFAPVVTGGAVNAVAVDENGKILVAGAFTSVNGSTAYYLTRLNENGTTDTSFSSPFTGTPATAVDAVAIQPDGKILIASNVTDVAGSGHDYLARLNADGTVDGTFHADATTNGQVQCFALQADGDILVGGNFTTVDGITRRYLTRLNSDGSMDTGFTPGINAQVTGVVVQTDGRIVICGDFSTVNLASMKGVAQLNVDGTSSIIFSDPAVGLSGGAINCVALSATGTILVGGSFSDADSATRRAFAELQNNAATRSLTLPTDTSARWLRGGSSNEIQKVEFSVSSDGQNWTSLGAGTRISGGWEITGLTLPESGYVRARAAGAFFANQPFVEQTIAFSALTPGGLNAGYDPAANGEVHATAEQPDGKTILGGTFTTVDSASHVRLVRLETDGTVDSGFTASASSPSGTPVVTTLAVQPDGKILVGGDFLEVNGVSHTYLARLNSDGSRDSGFNPTIDGVVNAIVLQPDGKILIGGGFSTVNTVSKGYLARLTSSGTLDGTFSASADATVHSVILQQDGKVVVGGQFANINSTLRSRIARVYSNGTLDTGFTASANDIPLALALQPNGKIVMGGQFSNVNGTSCTRLARLNSDSSLDWSFSATANGTVRGLTLQADGKILVSGQLTQLNSTATGYCGRLNSNGTLDSSFNAGADNFVLGSHLKKDGAVVLGGEFANVQSTARARIALLDNDVPYQRLYLSSLTRIEWARNGSSPEASRVTFELSTDGGSTWTNLGAGTYQFNTWYCQLISPLLPATGKIRARAYTPGGVLGASAGIVETVLDY